jgi:GH43 family beta-xylosidase
MTTSSPIRGRLARPLFIATLSLLAICRPFTVYAQSTATTFTNPLLPSGADPWVVQHNGWYYVTHTTGNNIRLYRTRTMTALANAEWKTIWTPPATGDHAKELWAPEVHFVNGRWYCYYAADDGNNHHHRMWVLENTSDDPFAGTWTDKGKVALADDTWAIDGTLLSHRGKLYFAWSGWEGDKNVSQDIYITRMRDPLTPEGPRVRISRPELPWEVHGFAAGNTPTVNEGPQFIAHGNRVYIVYSASGCWTDHYALGLLTANAKADLLDRASWKKTPEPVFATDAGAQAFGPGHCSFFTSPDGKEHWLFYHANPGAGQGCGGRRSARIQPFTWKKDLPVFGKPAALDTPLAKPSGEK